MFIKTISIILLLISFSTKALVQFPAGECELEGKLVQSKSKKWYFIINAQTNAETRFQLTHGKDSLGSEEQNVRIKIKLDAPVKSSEAHAKLIKITKTLNPFRELKIYKKDS